MRTHGPQPSTYYLPPATESEENLRLMRLIDQQFLKTPFYGSRRMTAFPAGGVQPVASPAGGVPAGGVRPSSAAHNAVGLAGESPVVGFDCLPK